MASPALSALKQQLDDLVSTYAGRFAGQSRVTREVSEIEDLIAKGRALVGKLEALPKSAKDAEFDEIFESAKTNVDMWQTEKAAIADAKAQGPAYVEFASLGTQANFVFARWRRHFAGKPRGTRDLGLLAEMIDDLTKTQARMKTLLGGKADTRMQQDLDLVTNNLKLYVSERGEIVDARNAGTPEEQADVLAEVANEQFKVYQDHFANKSRVTRRPELLQRMISNLEQVRDRMHGLQKGGLKSEHNDRNVGVVEANLEMYKTELVEIRKARTGVKLVDLMGALGGAANELMEEYREHYAGQDRKTRDLDRLTKLSDGLGELLRQMTALARAERNEMNERNKGIVTDNLVMLESEYEQIVQAKGEGASALR
jgi:hypothetical protein